MWSVKKFGGYQPHPISFTALTAPLDLFSARQKILEVRLATVCAGADRIHILSLDNVLSTSTAPQTCLAK